MDPQQGVQQDNLPSVNVGGDLIVSQTEANHPQPIASNVAYANQPLPALNSTQMVNVGATSSPSIADDVDLIEKEWVNKVNYIVQRTKGDPYERAQQLAVLKSDYLQKRYQKTIKLTQ